MSFDITLLFGLLVAFAIVAFGLIWYFLNKFKSTHSETSFNQATITEAFNLLGSEIKSLKEQLSSKEKLAIVGELSAGIAHELKNPLAVIAGYLRLLEKSPDCKEKEIIKKIAEELRLMDSVINELYKFSKFEPLDTANYVVTELINEAIQSLEPHTKQIDIVSEGDYTINVDKVLIIQALRNILQNAVYIAKQKIIIRVFKEHRHLSSYVCIKITDDGEGIQGDVKKIFEPLYSTKPSGLGMGLAIVQKVVVAHNGFVQAHNEKPTGASFLLYLPCK